MKASADPSRSLRAPGSKPSPSFASFIGALRGTRAARAPTQSLRSRGPSLGIEKKGSADALFDQRLRVLSAIEHMGKPWVATLFGHCLGGGLELPLACQCPRLLRSSRGRARGILVSDMLVHYRTVVYESDRWRGFPFRAGDIVITTPPKCGTTWTQRICALLVFGTPELDRPLTSVSPWLDMVTRRREEIVAVLEAQTHRRFIKSHTPRDGIPWRDDVTYLCVGRDPRDVALSWDNHVANVDWAAVFGAREAAVGNDDIADLIAQGLPPTPESERDRFWAWVADPTPPTQVPSSLLGVLHHLASFWEVRDRPNVVLLHYGDLEADLEGEMRRLAARLAIDVPEERWSDLVRAATFEEMRRDADRMAPGVTESIWQDNARFFRSGTSGQFRRLFGAGDAERYEARILELADPALAAWAHCGRS